jgi:integrase
MAKESFDQGPVMPLTPHLEGAGLDQEATRVAKVAFEIARIALGTPHPNDPVTDAMARSPNAITKAWPPAMKSIGLPAVTLHSLRHVHASMLIASGMDILTISRRLGHSTPTVTLGVYGHLIHGSDDRAAQIMAAAFGKVIG